MLFKLSSASGSSITKAFVRKEEGYSYLQNALSPQTNSEINLGILFCRELNGNLYSGTSEDGASWGFTVYSKNGKYKEEEKQSVEHKGNQYDLRRIIVKINFFDLIVHHRFSPCGCNLYRVDLCLPEPWCAKVVEISNCQPSLSSDYKSIELINRLLGEVGRYQYNSFKNFMEMTGIVH